MMDRGSVASLPSVLSGLWNELARCRIFPDFLTFVKKSGVTERKYLKYLCANTKGINFAHEKNKRLVKRITSEAELGATRGRLRKKLKQRKEKIMLVLGMIFAVIVAAIAEVGAISNKLA